MDGIVDELKLDLITGNTGTSTKEAITAITTAVSNLATKSELATVDGIVDELKLDLITGNTGTSTKEAITAITTAVSNLATKSEVTALKPAAKKYLRIQLTMSNNGLSYLSTKTNATCEAANAPEANAAPEHVLCCAKSGANTEVYIGKYTGAGTGSSFESAKSVCDLAKPNAIGDVVSLCSVDQVMNLKTSATATGTSLAYFMPVPNQKT